MADITFSALIDGYRAFTDRALAVIVRQQGDIATRDAAIVAAGLPDDQVPPPVQDDSEFVTALTRLNELDPPVLPADPGGDVQPDVDTLPEVPVDPAQPGTP